jgi:hypothetical protein
MKNYNFYGAKIAKSIFFQFFHNKGLLFCFKYESQFSWGFFWGILRFCKSKIGDFRIFAWDFFHFDLDLFWNILRPNYEPYWPQCTVAVWAQKKFFPLWRAPRGPMGVKKSHFLFYKWNWFPFTLRLTPKDTNFKNLKKCQKKPCFLRLFWIFFNLGAILAHQTSTGMFSGSWRIFWHPWDRLADFSLLWKCCPMSAL